MKTVEYLNQLEDEVQSLLDDEVFSKCDYSTYVTLTDIFGVLFQEIDEQRRVIERHHVLDALVYSFGKSEDVEAELAKKK